MNSVDFAIAVGCLLYLRSSLYRLELGVLGELVDVLAGCDAEYRHDLRLLALH